MISALLQAALQKVASKKLKIVRSIPPLAVIRAQNMRVPTRLLAEDPGKATDILLKNLKDKTIPEIEYLEPRLKTAADQAAAMAQMNRASSDFAQRHQVLSSGMANRPGKQIADRMAQDHAVRDPSVLDGEGKNVLKNNTKQNILSSKNIGRSGRGASGISHRFFNS